MYMSYTYVRIFCEKKVQLFFPRYARMAKLSQSHFFLPDNNSNDVPGQRGSVMWINPVKLDPLLHTGYL
jgi:hypothetical protein